MKTVGLVLIPGATSMNSIRTSSLLVILLACTLLVGCGGSRDKGKNQDFDRPKPTDKK